MGRGGCARLHKLHFFLTLPLFVPSLSGYIDRNWRTKSVFRTAEGVALPALEVPSVVDPSEQRAETR